MKVGLDTTVVKKEKKEMTQLMIFSVFRGEKENYNEGVWVYALLRCYYGVLKVDDCIVLL